MSVGWRFRLRKSTPKKDNQVFILWHKPSSNQAERALCEISQVLSKEYPEADNIIQNDVYVDSFFAIEETRN